MADTLASGASDRKVVEVQVLSWAPSSFAHFAHRKMRLRRDKPKLVKRMPRRSLGEGGLKFGPMSFVD